MNQNSHFNTLQEKLTQEQDTTPMMAPVTSYKQLQELLTANPNKYRLLEHIIYSHIIDHLWYSFPVSISMALEKVTLVKIN